MKKIIITAAIFVGIVFVSAGQEGNEDPTFAKSKDLIIRSTSVNYEEDLGLLIFKIKVEGKAGMSVPEAIGKLDGAPVLGYVFPTTLKSADVGFGEVEGIVALALTSHPDFDDTPLWDEN
ncbi:MAG: hypothetical protein RIM99_01115 [Cyclobacteriaceae bacterium]